MKPVLSALATFLLALFLIWYAGYDLLERSSGNAFLLFMALCVSVFVYGWTKIGEELYR